MADQKLTLEIEVTGAEDAKRKLGSVGGKVADNGQAVTDAGRKWGELGGAIGNVGAVAGNVSPQLGRMGGIIGQVGTATSALSGAMGPLGVALAGATAAIGLMSIRAEQNRRILDLQRQATDRLTESFDDLAQAADSAIDAIVRQRRIAAGGGTAAENIAGLQAETNRQTLIQRALEGDATAIRALRQQGLTGETRAGAGSASGIAGIGIRVGQELGLVDRDAGGPQLSETERRLLGVRHRESVRRMEELSQVAEESTAAIRGETGRLTGRAETLEGGGGRRPRRGGGGNTAASEHAERMRQQAAEQLDIEREMNEAAAERLEIQEAEQSALQGLIAIAADRQRQEQEHLDAMKTKRQEAHEQQIRRLEEQKAAQREANEKLKADAEGVLGPAVQSITAAVGEMILGTKTAEEAFQGMLSSFLQMIAEQAALSAVKEYAEAIAAFARYDMASGAQHLAAGVAFTGVAVAAGVGSAAVAPAAASAPASPQGGAGAPAGGGGGGNVTYNINGTIISSGGSSERARAGRELGALVSEGASRYGRAA